MRADTENSGANEFETSLRFEILNSQKWNN